MKVLHSICQQIWKTQQLPQDQKRPIFIPIPKRAMPKNIQTTVQLYSSHMLTRLCSKSFKLVNVSAVCELKHSRCTSWVQKGQRNQRSNCQHSQDHRKSKRVPEKHLLRLSVQFSLVAQSCPVRCHPMDCSTPGFCVHHQPLELTQIHVHRVSDTI